MAKAKLAIIDYGMGNLRSVQRAWEHVGAEARLVADPKEIGDADALIFPGQGAIVDTMVLLKETGFDQAIKDWVAADKPFFGICLGLQALFEHSEEGDTPGLGIFKGQVKRFDFDRSQAENEFIKVPHMGWNQVRFIQELPINGTLSPEDDQFYFVHSYYVEPEDRSIVWGETQYGDQTFVSAVAQGNCYATQFHPEKSQSKGLSLYKNFLEIL